MYLRWVQLSPSNFHLQFCIIGFGSREREEGKESSFQKERKF